MAVGELGVGVSVMVDVFVGAQVAMVSVTAFETTIVWGSPIFQLAWLIRLVPQMPTDPIKVTLSDVPAFTAPVFQLTIPPLSEQAAPEHET